MLLLLRSERAANDQSNDVSKYWHSDGKDGDRAENQNRPHRAPRFLVRCFGGAFSCVFRLDSACGIAGMLNVARKAASRLRVASDGG